MSVADARAALARHDKGRCNVKLYEYDNEAGTGYCARWAGHGAYADGYGDGHSGWPEDEEWVECLRAVLAALDAATPSSTSPAP